MSTEDPALVINRESRLLDVVVLAAVPAVLALLYALPVSLKEQLVFDYAEPTVLTAFTSHFVHLSVVHLGTNLLGYLFAVGLCYLLALAGGRRRQFFVVFSVYLLAFPFLLSGFNLLWGWSGVGLGFSGLIMAFVGYLPLTMFHFIGTRFGLPVDERRSVWLFFLGVAIAAFISLPPTYSTVLSGVALAAFVLFVVRLAGDLDGSHLKRLKRGSTAAGSVELVLFGLSVFVIYQFVAFSSELVVTDGILNVYTHGLGLGFGYAVAYVGIVSGWLDVS